MLSGLHTARAMDNNFMVISLIFHIFLIAEISEKGEIATPHPRISKAHAG
jgi:hypothetical protein